LGWLEMYRKGDERGGEAAVQAHRTLGLDEVCHAPQALLRGETERGVREGGGHNPEFGKSFVAAADHKPSSRGGGRASSLAHANGPAAAAPSRLAERERGRALTPNLLRFLSEALRGARPSCCKVRSWSSG
jgi:hypothetical protein